MTWRACRTRPLHLPFGPDGKTTLVEIDLQTWRIEVGDLPLCPPWHEAALTKMARRFIQDHFTEGWAVRRPGEKLAEGLVIFTAAFQRLPRDADWMLLAREPRPVRMHRRHRSLVIWHVHVDSARPERLWALECLADLIVHPDGPRPSLPKVDPADLAALKTMSFLDVT